MDNFSSHIGVIGLGNFGNFWYKWLSKTFPNISAYSSHSPEKSYSSVTDLVKNVDILFLCVPIGKLEEVLQKISPGLEERHLVIDVCSVKMKPVEWMKKYIPSPIKILATHPMFGPQSASESLKGQSFMYSKIRCHQQDIQWLLSFLEEEKVELIKMTPEEHDKIVAKTQALSFFVGNLLQNIGLSKTPIDTPQYKTLFSFVDEICKDTPELFRDMMHYNPYSENIRNIFLEETKKLMKTLEEGSSFSST
jgi:prephenate dehydrogenase